MSFASAFLGGRTGEGSHAQIASNVQALLQSISPEPEVGLEMVNVLASNLCYGVPMDWALENGQGNVQMRGMLRARLNRFEMRLSILSAIELYEDTENNTVIFFISGGVQGNFGTESIEIETKLSRMDQYAEEPS